MSRIVVRDFSNMSYVIKAEVLTPTNLRRYDLKMDSDDPRFSCIDWLCVQGFHEIGIMDHTS
jgi:hypothetical protein